MIKILLLVLLLSPFLSNVAEKAYVSCGESKIILNLGYEDKDYTVGKYWELNIGSNYWAVFTRIDNKGYVIKRFEHKKFITKEKYPSIYRDYIRRALWIYVTEGGIKIDKWGEY